MSIRCRLGFHAFERTHNSRTVESDFYDFGSSVRWDTRKQDEVRCTRCGLTGWQTIERQRDTSNRCLDIDWVRSQIAKEASHD